MVNQSGNNFCPVCLTNFNHIRVDEKKELFITEAGYITILLLIGLLAATPAFVYALVDYYNNGIIRNFFPWYILAIILQILMTVLLSCWSIYVFIYNIRIIEKITKTSHAIQNI
tara:strand:+ start:184 stop:525 length:342 start_codon:yes stop_codon:yes gene_type:complete